MHSTLVLAAAFALAGGLAFAQQATNSSVIARQQVMKGIGGSMKVLGDMASGKTAFDAAAARTAASTMATEAAKIEAVFQENVTEAESKASPKIWTDWAGFVGHANDLKAGAGAIDPGSLDSLKASLGAAGGTCRACHTDYRI